MSEIKTPPVVARQVQDENLFSDDYDRGLIPGSFRIEPDSDGELIFWYCCPCGCGTVGPLLVGDKFKPSRGPSWAWNGSTETPSLEPSVNHVGHWHGWLRNGVWESC